MCWTSMKLKNFCSVKYTFLHKIRKLKKQPTHRQGENIFKPFIYVGSNTHEELPPMYIYIYVYMYIFTDTYMFISSKIPIKLPCIFFIKYLWIKVLLKFH